MKTHSSVPLVSLLVSVVSLAIYAAEMRGFRVFDDGFGWHVRSKESAILSIPELLVFFGSLALGTICGLVALVSAAMWLKQRFLQRAPTS